MVSKRCQQYDSLIISSCLRKHCRDPPHQAGIVVKLLRLPQKSQLQQELADNIAASERHVQVSNNDAR